MSDTLVFGGAVLLFAVAATAHVAIAFGLSFREPRWRGPLALFVVPLAPYWALSAGMTIRGVTWLVAVGAYLALRILFRG